MKVGYAEGVGLNSPNQLFEVPSEFAIIRFDANAEVPSWANQASFSSITRTENELSIVAPAEVVPVHIRPGQYWRGFGFTGQLDFSLTGIVARISQILAAANVSIFAISTFDTGYVFVPTKSFDRSLQILEQNGYSISSQKN